MNRHITAAATAACFAIGVVATQPGLSAQTKAPAAKTAPAKAAPAKAAPAPAVRAAAAQPAGSITMTGCLEGQGRSYVLTSVEGAQAPKGRSWKTGFVTKRPKDVEVVAASGVKLGDHIGHKISIVGVRDSDVHLTARSVRQLAATCS